MRVSQRTIRWLNGALLAVVLAVVLGGAVYACVTGKAPGFQMSTRRTY